MDSADGVVVGLGTAVAEHYHAPEGDDLRIYVIADVPDVSGNPELFDSGKATLVLPADAGPAPAGVPEIRAGSDGMVDLRQRARRSSPARCWSPKADRRSPEILASLGLIDEFFLTVAPRVIAGTSGRVVRGPEADADEWRLEHGLVDDDGFLFLRYVRDPHRRAWRRPLGLGRAAPAGSSLERRVE